MPRLPMPTPPFHPDLKVPAVDAYVGDRVVAWLDDAFDEPAHRWARTRTAPTLLLDVDSHVGLTYDMVTTLTRRSRSHSPHRHARHAS